MDTTSPHTPPHTPGPHRIGIVVFERCQLIDATGPAAVFGSANEVWRERHGGGPLYEVTVHARATGPVKSSAGVSLHADRDLSPTPLDTLICAGGKGSRAFAQDRDAVNAVWQLANDAQRIVSVCTGAYVLAATGLLDGRRAVTHWAHCRQLANEYPAVRVEADPIFIQDGQIYTSAGVTAGMDLALALVEEDHGHDLALAVASEMVMFMKRPGTQAQFSRHLAAQMAPSGGIREVQTWLVQNLDAPINVEAMADRAAMSLRTFNRRFKDATGQTPAAYIQDLRVDNARCLLEESELPIKAIARHCGFGDEERMRRAFHRRLGVGPQDYRTRFSSPTA